MSPAFLFLMPMAELPLTRMTVLSFAVSCSACVIACSNRVVPWSATWLLADASMMKTNVSETVSMSARRYGAVTVLARKRMLMSCIQNIQSNLKILRKEWCLSTLSAFMKNIRLGISIVFGFGLMR